MGEIAAYRMMIEAASGDLRSTVEGLSPEQFGRRAVEGANPVKFIYFHVLRHWDRDINVFCRGYAEDADLWHSAGLSGAAGYKPLGKGTRGMGTGYGYSAAEVDEVPGDLELLTRYHELLHDDTLGLLDDLSPEDLDGERTSGAGAVFTVGSRLRHLIAHTYLHCGDIEYAKGLVGARAVDVPSITEAGGA